MSHVELVANNANERYLHPVFCNSKQTIIRHFENHILVSDLSAVRDASEDFLRKENSVDPLWSTSREKDQWYEKQSQNV